jgi:hypothetical protein
MDIHTVLADLREPRDQVDAVIAALKKIAPRWFCVPSATRFWKPQTQVRLGAFVAINLGQSIWS